MKKNIKIALYIAIILGSYTFQACSDFLDLEPKNKVPEDIILNDEKGIESFIANLYYQAPIEDFVYFPREGFNARGNTGSLTSAQYGTEAIHSEWPNWNELKNDWWEKGYALNRDINILLEAIPKIENIDKNKIPWIEGEAYFLRAYAYFALAKRYGGVPLIKEVQIFDPNFEKLKVPRSTEKETWDFILETCDRAIELLPETREIGTDNPHNDISKRRATKWAAYALKSRVALHAASVAKYWSRAPLSGEAVDKNLIGGMDASDVKRYYDACISASEAIMNSSKFGLFSEDPKSAEEAASNYQNLFMNPKSSMNEIIFMKGYGNAGGYIAHDYDGWNNPNQTSEGFPHRGRTNPILELVDLYENYNGTPGEAAPIVTTEDGIVTPYEGFNPSRDYRKFDTPDQIFKNKDARFFASVIYPHAIWKNTKIVIQGGIVKPDGSLLDVKGEYQHNGTTYYTFGANDRNQYSGFDGSADVTRSGFLMRKFLNENAKISSWLQSTTDFIDFRYAEILLNFAEAVIENNETAKLSVATKAINDIRKRAGHTTEIANVTLNQVLRERAVELAFENKNYWDLIRRRTYHTEFKNRKKGALVPYLDLRGNTPQYIFVRRYVNNEEQTFPEKDYYRHIPGTASNGAIQNPQH
ncbi:RagB/SusD family nutrient uptake outer membrane protein [Dysgonomonas massiliensis]|uniref:RagB/SusD family nutrient uptake outer membrane protein n=1 Tax=Dysgonomonas massiliensis TaxID=2040292 RepID=UPI000C76A34B|nr:RagB/SusD family nutrient uptake outer membrane protein [Dysgonomonas massiliensis]